MTGVASTSGFSRPLALALLLLRCFGFEFYLRVAAGQEETAHRAAEL